MNKKLHKILAIAALSLGLAAGLTACDSKTEEPDAPRPSRSKIRDRLIILPSRMLRAQPSMMVSTNRLMTNTLTIPSTRRRRPLKFPSMFPLLLQNGLPTLKPPGFS